MVCHFLKPSSVHSSTHQWNQEDTDRRTCRLRPHSWLRSCRAVKHTRSRQSDSARPGIPAHRSMSSHPRGSCILPCFGRGLESTSPPWKEARHEVHLQPDYMSRRFMHLWLTILYNIWLCMLLIVNVALRHQVKLLKKLSTSRKGGLHFLL